jgi:hypothetical protein
MPGNGQRRSVLEGPGDDPHTDWQPSADVPHRTTAAGQPVRSCTIMCEKSRISTRTWWSGLAAVGMAGQTASDTQKSTGHDPADPARS